MMILGVTGNFGSGKSVVAAMFKKRGARVIDADAVVRELLLNDERCRCAIRGVFGDAVVRLRPAIGGATPDSATQTLKTDEPGKAKDGSSLAKPGREMGATPSGKGCGSMTEYEIDREKLAAAAFADRRRLRKLEAILHPLVKEKIIGEIGKFRGKLIVLDVPLLIEAGWVGMVDAVIVVRATIKKEVLRLSKRSGHSRAEVLKRLKYQLPFRAKRGFADFVVDNRGRLGDTDKQVKKIFDSLIKKNH